MVFQILPNVTYRIQSVDYGTFLERRVLNGDDALVMRPEKDSTAQHWLFKQNEADRTYEIQNVEDQTDVLKLSITNNVTNGDVGTLQHGSQEDTPQRWRLIVDTEEDPGVFYLMIHPYGSKDTLLYMKDANNFALKRDSRFKRRFSEDDNYKWKICEVSPAELPEADGQPTYRIRTLNGYGVHVAGRALSIVDQDRGDHRAWEIISQGNGKCTIKNLKNKAYLDAERRNGVWAPSFSEDIANTVKWDIKKNSDFTYTISTLKLTIVGNRQVAAAFALTLDEQSVILKPAKEAHNQLWLIELADAALDTDSGVQVPDSTQVLPGLPVGEYLVRNVGNDHYIRLKSNQAVGTGIYEFQGSSASKNKFKLEVKGGMVYLSCTVQGSTRYLSLTSSSVVATERESAVMIEARGTDQYYICMGDNVLASNGSETLIVKPKTTDNFSLWKFQVANRT